MSTLSRETGVTWPQEADVSIDLSCCRHTDGSCLAWLDGANFPASDGPLILLAASQVDGWRPVSYRGPTRGDVAGIRIERYIVIFRATLIGSTGERYRLVRVDRVRRTHPAK